MAPRMRIMSLTLVFITSLSVLLEAAQSSPTDKTSKPATLFHHVKLLQIHSLQDLKNSASLSVVYYYVKDLPTSAAFFKEYEKSAKLLDAYAITLAVFDCEGSNLSEEKCKEKGVEQYVYTYQSGVELLPLEIETMFDVNSIMSNSLQLALLQEVPIVQSRLERNGLEKSFAGYQDLVFAYPQAVGTPEHRIFMEIAYIFQEHFKFALTTEFKSIYGLQGSESIRPSASFALWTLFCSKSTLEDVTIEGGCQSVLYRGEATLSSIASYIKRLSEKTLYQAPKDGTSSLFSMNDSFPIIYLYYSKQDDEKFEELVEILADDAKGFAKVVTVDMNEEECKAEATKQGFEGRLPGLSVKTNSDSITFMDSDEEWEISNIENFLSPFIFSEGQGKGEESEEEKMISKDADTEDSDLIQDVETQDDQVAKAVFSSHGKELRSVEVPSLLKSSFDAAIEAIDFKMILFYLPFDAISMAFLLDFDQAWRMLTAQYPDKEILYRVNCFDATDLCALQNITTYPLLRIFWKGRSSQLYEGPLDTLSIIKAAKLLMLNGPIVLQTKEEVESFVKGEFPEHLSDFLSTSVLLIVRPNDTGTIEVLDSASKQLSVFDMLGTVSENLLNFVSDKYRAVIPSVICFNRNDVTEPVKVLDTFSDTSTIVKFVKLAAIPTMPELGVANFPTLYALHRPFVILFVDTTDPASVDAKKVVTKSASMFGNAIFCWMNAQMKSLGIQLLSEYTWSASLPVVTVVDHSQAKVFNYQSKPLIAQDLTDWLMNVFTGKQEPSKLLPEKKWKAPGQHYDFLAMIDKEKKIMQGKGGSGMGNDDFDETLKRAEESIASDPEDEEYLKIENEIREELLELRKSRLYQYPELKQREGLLEEQEVQGEEKQKKTDSFVHDHVEL